MGEWLPLLATVPFVAVLLASGRWANRRYARFDELPGHYDIRGRATTMAPRRVMAWMLPVLFSIVLVAIAIFTALVPPEYRNGDPLIGILVGGLGLLAGHALVLWLTERWANRQP